MHVLWIHLRGDESRVGRRGQRDRGERRGFRQSGIQAKGADIGIGAARPRGAAPIPAEDSPLPPLPSDPRYSLAVIAGGQAGSVFQLHKPRILIGRGSAMDIQLRDSEVSRRHVAIEIRDLDVELIDLQATNGTWFEGKRIDRVKLNHQDEFTLGSTTLMLIVTAVRDA